MTLKFKTSSIAILSSSEVGITLYIGTYLTLYTNCKDSGTRISAIVFYLASERIIISSFKKHRDVHTRCIVELMPHERKIFDFHLKRTRDILPWTHCALRITVSQYK